MPSCLPLHNYIAPEELVAEGSTVQAIVERIAKNQDMIRKSLTVLDQNQRILYDEHMDLDSKLKKVIPLIINIISGFSKY